MFSLNKIKQKHRNPRKISKDSLELLKKSVSEFSKMLPLRPIIYDSKTFEIIGGNQRYTALIQLGFQEVPDDWVKSSGDMSEEEIKRFVLADNHEFGEWDFSILIEDYNISDLSDWALDIDIPEEFVIKEEPREDNYEIPKKIDTNIIEGDIIEFLYNQTLKHKLICGDSTKESTFTKLLDNILADLIITDPPYNVNYEGKTKDKLKIENDNMTQSDFYNFLFNFYSAINKFIKPGGVYYVWHADSEGHNFRLAMINAGIKIRQCLIWVKNTFVLGRQDYHWKHEPCLEGINENVKMHETCLYGWKDGAAHLWNNNRKQSTILEFDKPNINAEHPTMKPVLLIAYQIGNNSKEGDIVLDAFGGSGTTMVASHQTNRKCYMVEYDPKFCQVIIDRMIKLDPLLVVKINGQIV